MGKIAIVTDSTSYIPEDLRKTYNITVLPQILIWGQETFRDGVDITPDQFYTRLKDAKVMPSSSQITPAGFKACFEELTDQGYEVLAILISTRLSGTNDSAVQAKAMLPDRKIEIVDSRSTAMAMGFMTIKAAKAIQNGADIEAAKQVVADSIKDSGVLLTPETLEFLHRGGRIGNASRLLGAALNIKPILHLEDGIIEPLERIRTRGKALNRMVEVIAQRAAGRPVHLAALSANAEADARAVLESARTQMNIVEGLVSSVSPVVGTHVGPGTVALAYLFD